MNATNTGRQTVALAKPTRLGGLALMLGALVFSLTKARGYVDPDDSLLIYFMLAGFAAWLVGLAALFARYAPASGTGAEPLKNSHRKKYETGGNVMYSKAIRIGGLTASLILLVASGCELLEASGDSEETLISEEGRIAFTRFTSFEESDLESDIHTINVDGSGETRLTDSPGLDGLPAWSPDGERIVFTSDRDGGNWELYVMNADGSKQTRLTNTPEDEAGGAWSPNGEKIVFVFEAQGDDPSIWVMNADGSGRTRLASGDWPDWSPDGKRIVYTSGQWNDPRISVMNADGSERRTLDVRGASEPAWSPDGEKIAYVADVGPDKDTWDNEEVFVMNPDGSGRSRLTDIPGNDHWPPTWSPDGTRIAFTSDGDGPEGKIQAMNLDGSGLTTLTDGGDYDAFPAWRP